MYVIPKRSTKHVFQHEKLSFVLWRRIRQRSFLRNPNKFNVSQIVSDSRRIFPLRFYIGSLLRLAPRNGVVNLLIKRLNKPWYIVKPVINQGRGRLIFFTVDHRRWLRRVKEDTLASARIFNYQLAKRVTRLDASATRFAREIAFFASLLPSRNVISSKLHVKSFNSLVYTLSGHDSRKLLATILVYPFEWARAILSRNLKRVRREYYGC